MVEFELEESISDEEAEKLINESSLSSDISDTDQFSVNTEVDLFTARLMKYEVLSQVHN